MGRFDPLAGHCGARRLDQRLEARFLAERRKAVAGQVDRQRRAAFGQQALQRPPSVEIGAEAMQEHDGRAFAAREPQPVHARRRRPRRLERLDVAPLHAPEWA